LAVAEFKSGDLACFGVGQERGEAVAAMIGELELGPGMGTLFPADQAGALRPTREVNPVGELGDPGAFPVLTFRLDRRLPVVFRGLKDCCLNRGA